MALGKLGKLLGNEDAGPAGAGRKYQEPAQILEEIIYQAKLSNTFLFSGWESVDDALDDLLPILEGLERNDKKSLKKLDLLFEPKGSLQELATDNGWTEEYDRLAERFDLFMEALESGSAPATPSWAESRSEAKQPQARPQVQQRKTTFEEDCRDRPVIAVKKPSSGSKVYRFYADLEEEDE